MYGGTTHEMRRGLPQLQLPQDGTVLYWNQRNQRNHQRKVQSRLQPVPTFPEQRHAGGTGLMVSGYPASWEYL